jgi:predicted RNA-binding protein with PUA-like domain
MCASPFFTLHYSDGLLGDAIKATMPRGQQSDSHLYFALEPRMAKIRGSLTAAGLAAVDNLVADVFLWWAKQELERLGPVPVAPRRVWLFQANPKLYDLEAAVQRAQIGDTDSWVVSRYRDEMREGDTVVLWQGGDNAGIYAIGELIGEPHEREQQPTEHELDAAPYLKNRYAVDFRFTLIPDKPISRRDMRVHPVLANSLIIRNPQGTNFRVTPEEWAAIQDLLGESRPPINGDLRSTLSRSLAATGLHFTEWQIATFYTALQTKAFIILSGISGTGKSKLAQHFAAHLTPSNSTKASSDRNWLFLPVRPDWRDGKSLLGYFNPLTGTYEWTPFLRFLVKTAGSYRNRDGLAWFVILDEMNLAHVEYYFADLLSVLESGRDGDGWTREPLRLAYPNEAKGDLPPRELFLPPNLYIVGTVNVDETTHAFSPKVIDRAFTLELTEADFSSYPPAIEQADAGLNGREHRALVNAFTADGEFAVISKHRIAAYLTEHPNLRTRLQNLNNLLRPYDLHFGYRVFDEIVAFNDAAGRNGLFDGLGTAAAFDAAVLMKVLPKFHGSRGKLESPLRAVLAWCVDPDAPAEGAIDDALQQLESGDDAREALSQLKYECPAAAERVMRMLRVLYTDGFAAF